MTPFTKLKCSSNLIKSPLGDNLIFYGEQQSIGFFKIPYEIEEQLFQIIPEKYRSYFSGSCMHIKNSYIRPHTDSDRTVGINFYVDTERAITKFFKKTTNVTEVEKVSGQTNGFVYQESDLLSLGSFVAEPGDIWILDVSKIHSVVNPTGADRVAYTLSSNSLSYSETLELLKELI